MLVSQCLSRNRDSSLQCPLRYMRLSLDDIKIVSATALGVGNHFVEHIDIGVKLLISVVTLAYVSVKFYRLLKERN
jgi:hypothetical protein